MAKGIKIMKANPNPSIDLVKISGEGGLVTTLRTFGEGSFRENIEEMRQHYSNPKMGDDIQLRGPTTAESILIASKEIGKYTDFIPHKFQIGGFVKTSQGIFVNPPNGKRGNPITDKRVLKSYLNGTKPKRVGRGKIYIVSNSETLRDFGFAEYGTFGVDNGFYGRHDWELFLKGGLAKVLEHTEGEAKNLKVISSFKIHANGGGVRVKMLDDIPRGPNYRVIRMESNGDIRKGQTNLDFDDISSYDGGHIGSAYGVLDEGRNK